MDSEVYNQSICMMSKVAYSYYIENKSQSQIAEELQVSKPTISRILKKAHQENIIQISINEPYGKTILLEKELKKKFHLKEVIVVPPLDVGDDKDPDYTKKQVALEGARYVQRIIDDGDNVGLAWGGTMYYFIQYLNPCRKVSANMMTLHGNVDDCDSKFEAISLVKRAAMSFGGKNVTIDHTGFTESQEDFCQLMARKDIEDCFQQLKKLDISVSGVGSLYPEMQSPIIRSTNLSEKQLQELKEQDVRCDLLLRFIDKDGKECETDIKKGTLAISIDDYKKIPCKIILASGEQKSDSVMALLKGDLVDVLIIDYALAVRLDKR